MARRQPPDAQRGVTERHESDAVEAIDRVLNPSRAGKVRQSAGPGVLLLDCARLGWTAERAVSDLEEGRCTYEALLHGPCLVPEDRRRASIPPAWSSPDRFVPAETALVRYANVLTRPWVHGGHPHGAPWYRELFEALASGAISRRLVDEEVQRGHVAPEVIGWARAALGARGAA